MEAEEASLDHVQGRIHSEVSLQLPAPCHLWASDLQRTIQRHPAASALLLAQVGHRRLPNGKVFCSLSISVNDKGGIWGRGESVHELPSNCQEVWRPKAATSPMEPTHPASSRWPSTRNSLTQWFCQSSAVHPGGMPNIPSSLFSHLLRRWCLIAPVCARHSIWHPPLEGQAGLVCSSVTVTHYF